MGADGRPESAEFLRLILAGDRLGAEQHAISVFEAYGVRPLYEMVQAALWHVGELWRERRITVADEHLATATAQAAVAALYPRYPWARGEAVVLVGCVEGNRHELGARMVSDLFALEGWDDRFLGADVPVGALVETALALRPRVVALSIKLEAHEGSARRTVQALRRALPEVKIVAGGNAAGAVRDLVESGALDAVAGSAFEGVEVARTWR